MTQCLMRDRRHIIDLPYIDFTGDYVFTDEGSGNWHLVLTSSGTLVIHGFSGNIDRLVVAGGASGGMNNSATGGSGGGGAGEVLYAEDVALPTGEITVVIGTGGAAVNADTHGNDGGDTSFGDVTADGGGGGGHFSDHDGEPGGCGGGGSYNGGIGAVGDQGDGANSSEPNGGGGGGANGNASGVNGGAALSNSITGAAVNYGKGGHGGQSGHSPASGANPGDAGDGVYADQHAASGAGHDGIVIIRNAR